MSLINKMLQDLEARQDVGSGSVQPVYQDLRPVRMGSRFGGARAAMFLVLVSALVVAVYIGMEKMAWVPGAAPLATVEPQRSTAPPASVAPAAPQVPATVSATPPVSAVTEVEEPKPTAGEVKETPVAIAPPPPRPMQMEPKSVPKANIDAEAKSNNTAQVQPAGSQMSAAPGIVRRGALPSVAVSPRERKPAEVKAPPVRTEPAFASSEESGTVVDKKVRPITAEENAEAGYRRALRLLDHGRADDALRQLREALAAQPTHVKARELAAGIQLQNGHWREAQSLLEEGLRHVSNQYLFARMLARVYVDHGAEAKALAVMESAAPQGSDDADFSALLGLLYQRTGRHTDAVKAYERAVALRPNDSRSWLGFAISLEGVEQWGAAKTAYRRAQQGDLTPSLARYAEQRLAAIQNQ